MFGVQPSILFEPWQGNIDWQFPEADITTFPEAQPAAQFQASYPTPSSTLDPFPPDISGDNDSVILLDPGLPADDILTSLVEIYFDKLYHVLPCFHKRGLMDKLRSGDLQTQNQFLLYSICCASASFHPDPAIRARRSDWYEQAKLLYEFTGRNPYPALPTIQGVLFLVYHAYSCGDFSACWLYIGKAWRQAASLGMNRIDSTHAVVMPVGAKDHEHRGYYDRLEWDSRKAIEREECRRSLWLLYLLDRNQSWPTGWPNAIDEKQFKIDIPVADVTFQAMTDTTEPNEVKNAPFTRNMRTLLASINTAKSPLNMLHYLIITYVLLSRVTEQIHSLHDNPDSPEYAEQCEELEGYVVKLRLSLPRPAVSVIEAAAEDRGWVIWLNATLNTISILLHYRSVPSSDSTTASTLFRKAVTAARNTAQVVTDSARTSIDLLLNVHIASCLYVACCVLVIHMRLDKDESLKNDVELLGLVFERMNDVFTVLGMKFHLALKRDLERDAEELLSLRERGYRGLLADCSKWGFVRDEIMKMGMTIT